jgi:hypothetical protein
MVQLPTEVWSCVRRFAGEAHSENTTPIAWQAFTSENACSKKSNIPVVTPVPLDDDGKMEYDTGWDVPTNPLREVSL